ncbi:MAG: hypothetical protein JG767_298 [Deferribacteraceae bacterium]|jgi:hypothetical protein|nr:hypothetical protein [Deferribacteraceae bacterium]
MEKSRNYFRFGKFKINKNGFALVTVLVFAAAMLILATSVYYFIIQGTKFSGSVKRYSSLKEATEGGVTLGIEIVKNYNRNIESMFSGVSLEAVDTTKCGLSGNSLDSYIINADPEDIECTKYISTHPWFKFESGNYEVSVYIIKVFQGALSGVGGSTSFTATSNVGTYKYLFKIISQGKDKSSDSTIITEALYRLVI